MNKFVSIGFNNVVNSEKVVAVFAYNDKISKTIMTNYKIILDASSGRQVKSIILTECDQIILCGLNSDTILQRLNN